MGAVGLAAALVVYANLANRWRAYHGWAYVPLNALAGAVLLVVARVALGLDAADLGLRLEGAALGFVVAAPAVVVLVVASWRPAWRARLADRRYAGVRSTEAVFIALVRIPIGTALFEELAFRGALYAAFAGEGRWAATGASGLAFGLWHLGSTRLLVRANRPGAARIVVVAVVAGGVAATAAAGMGLAWLRIEGGGIAAPVVVHAVVNVGGALAAINAHRAGGGSLG